MHARREAPALRRLHVGVRVIALGADAVRIPAEAAHQHVDGAHRAISRGRDDVIDVQVNHALPDPADVLAAAHSAAGHFGQLLASLPPGADGALLGGGEEAVGGKEIGVVVAIVRAGVDGARVLRDELLDLDVVERGQRLRGRRRRGALRSGRHADPGGECDEHACDTSGHANPPRTSELSDPAASEPRAATFRLRMGATGGAIISHLVSKRAPAHVP